MQDYEPQATWTAGAPLLSATPASPVDPAAPSSVSPSRSTPSRGKRLMAAGLLALGMIAGGAAIVSAASPDPSTSTAPAAGGTQPAAPGGTGMPANGADCPNM